MRYALFYSDDVILQGLEYKRDLNYYRLIGKFLHPEDNFIKKLREKKKIFFDLNINKKNINDAILEPFSHDPSKLSSDRSQNQ